MANQALARTLAALFWRLLARGKGCVEAGLKKHENKAAETGARWRRKLARKHGRVLLPKPA